MCFSIYNATTPTDNDNNNTNKLSTLLINDKIITCPPKIIYCLHEIIYSNFVKFTHGISHAPAQADEHVGTR